jgi:hypothetical protein
VRPIIFDFGFKPLLFSTVSFLKSSTKPTAASPAVRITASTTWMLSRRPHRSTDAMSETTRKLPPIVGVLFFSLF